MKRKHTKQPAAQVPAPQPRREVARLSPDPEQGLTLHQVKERQQNGWANDPVDSPTKTVGQIVRENVFTFFNFIFVVLAALLVAVGSFDDMLFLLIAVANTGIGIVQQLRSKQTVDKLNLLAAPRANVVREGNLISVPAAQLVRDDVAELASGDQIPADATVLSGQVQVNEALITGEADAITKAPGDELLSGAFVVSGRCRARLDRVGAESYAARLTLEAKKDVTVGKSEMMSSLDKLIRIIGILLIPIGVALFVKEFVFLERTAQEAVVSMVAALIGMIPEGLYLLTSVALAVSMMRLARRKVLTRDMNCIETLARVDTLCVDKTGTITESAMQADDPLPLAENEPLDEILASFYAGEQPDNDTGRALAARFGQGGTGWFAQCGVPFNTAYKYSAKDFGAQGCYVVGAPDVLAGVRAGEFADKLAPLLAQGRRVLLLAKYNAALPDPPAALDPAQLEFLALLPLQNRIRENAPKTFRYFAKQGVAVKVISGDDPQAVSHVAANAGIAGAERWVDAATLRSEQALAETAEKCTVFGRVTPEQKRQLVHALQAKGHTVAMTGDGVNDVLALKDADCGIAMASGAQAASQVAQLVLLDSDFAALPSVVGEGRRVINNIQRSASLFLVKNIFSFLLSIVALALPLAYPFQPLQLSLVTFATIGAPAFFLALEPNHELVRGKFMRNVLRAALPGGLTDFLLVFCTQGFGYAFDIPTDMVGTICTFVILCVGLQILWGVCIPFTPLHWIIWGGMTVMGVAGAFLLAPWLPLVRLDLGGMLVLVVLLALSAPTLAGLTFMGARLNGMVNDARNKIGRRKV